MAGTETDPTIGMVTVKSLDESDVKKASLDIVFVVDVSGSMAEKGKLDTMKKLMSHLIDQLEENHHLGKTSKTLPNTLL